MSFFRAAALPSIIAVTITCQRCLVNFFAVTTPRLWQFAHSASTVFLPGPSGSGEALPKTVAAIHSAAAVLIARECEITFARALRPGSRDGAVIGADVVHLSVGGQVNVIL